MPVLLKCNSTLNKISKIYKIIRYNGVGFCAFRAQYELRKKSGLLKRKFPPRRWEEINFAELLGTSSETDPEKFLKQHSANGRRFFFEIGNLPPTTQYSKEKVLSAANEILKNRFQYFFDKSYDLGSEPDWFLNPVTNKRAGNDRHWCDINMFDPAVGDIKFIWELSRFAWAYTLVRAYAVSKDNKYTEKFWSLFESWLDSNQPNMGLNYVCGQECAIRLMAMVFAFYALAAADSSTIARKIKLAEAIVVHAERIEKNIAFAISTHTNHSLTEAAGLYTAGILFPEFKRSGHWVKLGKKVLAKEGLKQIYTDGSYIQHSMNYHRLMLQDFLWVIQLAHINGDRFCDELMSCISKAVNFLYQMQDEVTGKVPNYGANDGAIIIPLNNCGYSDYRPVLQAMYYLLNGTRLYTAGLWDEDLVWFFGTDSLSASPTQAKYKSAAFAAGGYYTIRNKNTWAMMRCHSFCDRPGHSDMLHLDLWWKGRNILRDSGTYMYNCPQPWQSFFGSATAHNTIAVDNSDQMERLSRFMWSDWIKSKFSAHKSFRQGGINQCRASITVTVAARLRLFIAGLYYRWKIAG